MFSNISITYYGRTIQFPNVIIDTGSRVSIDVAQKLFNENEPEDQIRFMTGIGGREAAVRRKENDAKYILPRISMREIKTRKWMIRSF